MNVYFDTSVIVSLISEDAFTVRAERALRRFAPTILVSDFARTECASVLAGKVRERRASEAGARWTFEKLDRWLLPIVTLCETQPADIQAAEGFLRRLDLPLRAPDAIHIAIARRLGATLATFDVKMAAAARTLGLDVAPA